MGGLLFVCDGCDAKQGPRPRGQTDGHGPPLPPEGWLNSVAPSICLCPECIERIKFRPQQEVPKYSAPLGDH